MTRSICILAASVMAGLVSGPVAAQQPQPQQAPVEPRITLMLSNAERVYTILDFAMGLTPAQDQRQTPIIKDNLDLFLIGIQRTRPIRVDVLSAGNGYRYRPSFPVARADLNNFRFNNLQPLGINTRQVAATLFRAGGNVWEGWMRYRNEYASFGVLEEDVPADLPDPQETVAPLLRQGYDTAFHLENAALDRRDVEARYGLFVGDGGIRPDLLEQFPRREGESARDFEIRHRLWEAQLDELQRLYAEAVTATFASRTDLEQGEGRIHLDVAPIPETPLAESIALIGQRPSRFADLERRSDAVLSGRLNRPLDSLRQENLLEIGELLRTHAKNRLETEPDLADAEREASRRVVDMIYDLLEEGTRQGLADIGVEVYPGEDGAFTGVGGFAVADGAAVRDILELLPETGGGREVELEVDSEGDVPIHVLRFSAERYPGLDAFFGGNTVYVGTADDTAWLAAGPTALADLKRAISQAVPTDGEPRPEDPYATLFLRLQPWVELRDRMAAPDGEFVEYRRLAIAAFAEGDDVVEMRLDRIENDIRGTLAARRGLFRFVGRALAEFSRENLE